MSAENQKSWYNTTEGPMKAFYPGIAGKPFAYALFTPSVDRFIAIDYDMWSLFETAKILSSKISPIVYVLCKPTPKTMNNSNCLEFGTKHKMFEKEFGGGAVSRHKQSATLRKIQEDSVVELGWPEDYASPSRSAMLNRLQDYALFTLSCVKAINITTAYRNTFPERDYSDNFHQGLLPDSFRSMPDLTTAPNGINYEIKNILYYSDTVEEAIEKINEAWVKYSLNDPSGLRQFFYIISGLTPPEESLAVGKIGEWNKDYHNSTAWVL